MTSECQSGRVQHLNPDELPKNSAFTNVVVVTGAVKTVYVGGHDGWRGVPLNQ